MGSSVNSKRRINTRRQNIGNVPAYSSNRGLKPITNNLRRRFANLKSIASNNDIRRLLNSIGRYYAAQLTNPRNPNLLRKRRFVWV